MKTWLDSEAGPLRAIDVALDDRLPSPAPGRLAITDADGDLQAALAALRGRFVLVKPDRYIAAAVSPDDFPQLETLMDRYLTHPAVTATAS
jgi:3-(3-hydroxy-phenyl)propionate hydroxylase